MSVVPPDVLATAERDPLSQLFAPDRTTVPLLLAPMAGVTDWPFRLLARRYGAEMTVSEMVASQAMIRHVPKSIKMASRLASEGLVAVQIAGADPEVMAEAARMNVDLGAPVIDINMGCPVKKIAKSHAGAALMRDERLAGQIMAAVVGAVPVPVTVKMRLGWDDGQRNALAIARIAEASGVRAVTVHGRTRAQMYAGEADWQAIAEIKAGVSIPVVGNGDVTTPEGARRLREVAGVDGIMIGRGAMGAPWIFRSIAHYLRTGEHLPDPEPAEKIQVILEHYETILSFHGLEIGNRLARKHLAWHTRGMVGGGRFRERLNHSPNAQETRRLLREFLGVAQCDGEGEGE
ncbi:MAG: tRNA dihydrouridine synthase DusB [Magnetococcales bacterium]|nr:tRNA dihydrouridine synthase DusB [Magnetococcales bacterium]